VTGILHGLRLVEMVAFVAGPMAGMTLAQTGADVVRIDPIGGGVDNDRWPLSPNGVSLYWAGLNKGTRSVALNLRQPEGRDIARALIVDAGAFLTNLQARGELAYEALRQARPDLIMTTIRGNPDGGIAVDYTVNAMTGLPYLTGPLDAAGPVNHVFPMWDMAAALSAVNATLAAERWRRETGQGQHVTLALADVALAMMSHLGFLADAEISGRNRPKMGNHVYGTFGRDFATSDGRRLIVVVVTDRQWKALGEATGLVEKFALLERLLDVDLRREGDRHRARDLIAAVIEPWCAARTMQQIAATFEAAGVLWGPYRTTTEMLAEDPRCSLANNLLGRIDQPGVGPHLAAGSIADFSEAPREPPRRAPQLGEHTEEVLSERLGFSQAKIGQLIEQGIAA